MKSDFSDLRFTDSSGTTSIPYWKESTTAGATTTVWVNLPSLPASGSATIYMYFGNSSATSSDSGASTFPFFEDFEQGNLSGYSGDTTLFSVDGSFAHNGSFGLDAGTNSGQKTTTGIFRSGTKTSQGETVRYFQYVDASQQDEPCTLFGLQSSGHDYAVCLEEFPSQQLVIAKNVTSNDTSGTILASSTVTYATGWYQVSVDWLTTNAINVTVYDSTGAVFATLSTTDSTYTSGGMGFSYWFQHGGWDFFTARQYAASAPTAIIGAKQDPGGATFKAAEDTALTGANSLIAGQNIRLRFSIQNSGAAITGKDFRLQVAPKGASLNCASVPFLNYTDVPPISSCGTAAACMATSSFITNQSSTGALLDYPTTMNFTAGQAISDPSNQTSAMNVGANTATEVEYTLKMTSSATGAEYCFRSSDSGSSLDNYAQVADAVILHAPTISNISFNNAQDIALTEGTTTTITASSTVTDLNGFTDISFATSTFYRSGVGAQCSANENSCYLISTSSCALSSCSGNSCTLSCSAKVQYFADPTDSGTFLGQHWLATMAVQDSTGLRDTETSLGVNVLTLYGLSITTGNINFGSLAVGGNTGSVDSTTTVANTGNSNINIQLSGTDLTSGSDSIPVGEQKYATSTFIYGSCSICQFLTGSATNVSLEIAKPTSSSTPSTGSVYWGIDVPPGTQTKSFTGTNTFIAVGG